MSASASSLPDVIMSALFWESYRCPACLVDLEGLHFLPSGDHEVPAEWLAAAYLQARYSMLFPWEHFLNQYGLLGKPGAHWVLWNFLPKPKIFKTVRRYMAVLEQHKGSSKISGRNFADELIMSMKNGTDTACISLPRNPASYWGLEAVSDRGKWKMNCS